MSAAYNLGTDIQENMARAAYQSHIDTREADGKDEIVRQNE